LQIAHNEEHGITPTTIRKAVRDMRPGAPERDYLAVSPASRADDADEREPSDPAELWESLRAAMLAAAEALEFEKAAELRDRLVAIGGKDAAGGAGAARTPSGARRPRGPGRRPRSGRRR
jgi:excinuclease ABC subunit B